MTNVTDDFFAVFEDAIAETGASLQVGAAELAVYAAERSAHLATLVGDPGFSMAVRAERDAVALKAGIVVVQQADLADARLQRLVAVIQGGLSLAAKLIAVA